MRFKFFEDLEKSEWGEAGITYGLGVLMSVGVVLGAWVINMQIGELNPLLLFLVAVTLSVWVGNYNHGLLALGITLLGYIYFFLPPNSWVGQTDFNTWWQLGLFVIESTVISLVIDQAKKTDEVARYKKIAARATQKLEGEQAANLKAQNEIKARDEFLSIASHELKTPLTSMLLQIQIALHNIRNVSLANFSVEKLLKMLENVEQHTGRLSRMISDLLNVSLITTGKLNLEVEEMDLMKIVKEVVDGSRLTMKNYPLTVDGNGPIVGKWDKVRIEQAVVNLVSNAIKYGNSKPVEVKVEKHNGIAKLIVKDNGIGIPKDKRSKIFARFGRGVSEKDYQGLGVGLYITNQIIRAHGGNIKVDSKDGKGSTFTIELPIK